MTMSCAPTPTLASTAPSPSSASASAPTATSTAPSPTATAATSTAPTSTAPTATAAASTGPANSGAGALEAPAHETRTLDPAAHEGWQALAAASLGRLLSSTELAAVRHLPTELALDLLFPDLTDPARHEALATIA